VFGGVLDQPAHIFGIAGRHHSEGLDLIEAAVRGVEVTGYGVELDIASNKSA
jgi:hypothetical protein